MTNTVEVFPNAVAVHLRLPVHVRVVVLPTDIAPVLVVVPTVLAAIVVATVPQEPWYVGDPTTTDGRPVQTWIGTFVFDVPETQVPVEC